jgi:L,D-transpeptidase catalytic domain/Putative peptidoglycan binding domain
MTRGRLILVVVALAALAGAGIASAYGYERSRDGVIADGVSVGGVDVGGLGAREADQKVRRALAAGLATPIVVRSVRSRFVLQRKDFSVRPDVEPAVRRALAESGRGSFLSRTWRDVFGGGLDVDEPVDVHYSRGKVDYIVRGVQRSLDRRPHDARLIVSVTSLQLVPGSWGRRVDATLFRRELAERLVRPGSRSVLRVPTRIVRPRMGTQRLIARNAYYITIDRGAKRLRLFRRLKLAKTYTIAVGRIGLETPAGYYRVRTKAVNPAWYVPKESWAGSLAGKIIPGDSPDNPIKARWLGIYDGAGIHGTDDIASLGTAASHGCIRMSIPDVKQLYSIVPVGTPIYIV